jgi:ferredoxin-NADP reductase
VANPKNAARGAVAVALRVRPGQGLQVEVLGFFHAKQHPTSATIFALVGLGITPVLAIQHDVLAVTSFALVRGGNHGNMRLEGRRQKYEIK